MNHATRMLLIPEDFYKSIIGMEKTEEKLNNCDGTALGLIRERLHNTGENRMLDPNTKAARYEQDFKRYNKLVRDKEEKPLNVKLKNIGEIADTLLLNKNENNANNNNDNYSQKIIRKKIVVRGKKKSIFKGKPNRILLPAKLKDEPESTDAKNIEEESEYFSPDSEPDIGEQALKYIKENSRALGVTSDLKMIKKIGEQELLYNSNVEKIIKYILRNKSVRRKPIPIGYDEFIRRINSHTSLRDLLLPPSTSTKQTGKGVFSFKPTLWKNQN